MAIELTNRTIGIALVAFLVFVAFVELAGIGTLSSHWTRELAALAGSLLISEGLRRGAKATNLPETERNGNRENKDENERKQE